MNRTIASIAVALIGIIGREACVATDLTGSPSNSNITVKSGDYYDWVYGGRSTSEDVHSNKVTMTGGTVGHTVYGGYASTSNGKAYNNSLTISGGQAESWSYGGIGNIVYKNTITVTGGYGGVATAGRGTTEAYENTITVSGGTVAYARGGETSEGYVHDNLVVIKGNALVYNEIYGGGTNNNITSNNTVEIQGGTAQDDVYGGYTTYGTGTGNKVIVSGGNISGLVCGAYGLNPAGFTNNSVVVTNGTIGDSTYGAYMGTSSTGAASHNKVEISGGTLTNVFGAFNYNSDAEYNEVVITGGVINGVVRGGSSVNGQTRYNTVTIHGGTVKYDVYGGGGNVSNNNTVNLYGGVLADVYGAPSGSNNKVEIFGDITVGAIGGQKWQYGDGNVLKINGHKLTASSVVNFDDYQFVLPSTLSTSETVITITGSHAVNMGFSTVSYFEDPGDILSSRDLVVLIDKASGDFQETFFNGIVDLSAISVSVKEGRLVAELGLLEEEIIPGDKGETGDKGEPGDKGEQGDKGEAGDKGETGDKGDQGDKGEDGDKGEAGDKGESGEKGEPGDKGEQGDKGEVGDKGDTGDKGPTGDPGECACCAIGGTVDTETELERIVRNQTEALTYSMLGQIGLINQSTDMVINVGIDRALQSLEGVCAGDFAAFFASSVGKDRYKTGGHVDVKGVSAIAGIAFSPKGVDGLAFGLFAEFGKGDSDSQNAHLTGSGDNEFTGGGLLARFSNILGSGAYLEATARMGQSKVTFGADGFVATASGKTRSVQYDIKGNYYGAHLGIGKMFQLGDRLSVDYSAKYLWSRQTGDSVLAAGENLQLSSIDSHRIRAGARTRYSYNCNVSFYGGAWLEHEFSGNASVRSVASGKRVRGGSLKGTTGVGEIGISIGSGRAKGWLLDVGVSGHVGKRRGISGNAGLSVSF